MRPWDWDALTVLSGAKSAALDAVLSRAFDAARGIEAGSVYEAMEAWRFAANAYDHLHAAMLKEVRR